MTYRERPPRELTADERAELRRERIGWLRTLIVTFENEHDWDEDEDPAASEEMLRECRALADELERELPAPTVQTQQPPTPNEAELPY